MIPASGKFPPSMHPETYVNILSFLSVWSLLMIPLFQARVKHEIAVPSPTDGLTSLQNVLVDSNYPHYLKTLDANLKSLMLNKYFLPHWGILSSTTPMHIAPPLCALLILTLLTGLPSFRTTYHLRNSFPWMNYWSSTKSLTCSCQNQNRQNLILAFETQWSEEGEKGIIE